MHYLKQYIENLYFYYHAEAMKDSTLELVYI